MASVEQWKPIPGYEGLYEVSDAGNVRSLKRFSTSGKVLKQNVSRWNGYCTVSLSKHNKVITRRVHVLVMSAFRPVQKKHGYDKNYTINHIDGDKTNNALNNLEWCTQSENQIHAFKNGLNPVYSRQVINLDTGEVYKSLVDASRSVGGRRATPICRVCSGMRSQYRNAHFAYYDDYLNGTVPAFRGGFTKRSAKALWV